MDPNRRFLCGFTASRFGKATIDLLKNLPVGIINIEIRWKRMEDWPKGFFGGYVIKA